MRTAVSMTSLIAEYSNYWAPQLYHQNQQNKSYTLIPISYVNTYCKSVLPHFLSYFLISTHHEQIFNVHNPKTRPSKHFQKVCKCSRAPPHELRTTRLPKPTVPSALFASEAQTPKVMSSQIPNVPMVYVRRLYFLAVGMEVIQIRTTIRAIWLTQLETRRTMETVLIRIL